MSVSKETKGMTLQIAIDQMCQDIDNSMEMNNPRKPRMTDNALAYHVMKIYHLWKKQK